jgi:hypothetical protein
LKAAIPRHHDGIIRQLNRKEHKERRESSNKERGFSFVFSAFFAVHSILLPVPDARLGA